MTATATTCVCRSGSSCGSSNSTSPAATYATKLGGVGGGGAGGVTTAAGTAGTANTGGGGGGHFNANTVAGAGGSGIVIIRYPDTFKAATSTTGSPTITVTGGYRIYKWTSSGSITF